ncbi:DUF5317 domain-containing protein [Paenibacillus sp. FSL W8-1187]|uniref:DUF5317 domain-containing protein n=1 Tax=Paenibacillus sp. FSL W8-1187 TaxID=2975339 RepID=UPI0030D7190E
MVYDGILLGLIVGFIRAGWKNGLIALSHIKIRFGWVFPVLLLVQFGLFYFQEKNDFIASVSSWFFMVIYVVGLVLLWLNRSQKGFGMLFAGVFLNFLVMLANGGRMPVSLEAASVLTPEDVAKLQSGEIWFKHTLLHEGTRLAFLGDIIPIGPPYPRKQAISLGDVLMNIGIFIYLQFVMIGALTPKDKLESQNA